MQDLEYYTNYREYLKDYYKESKEKRSWFSYRYFARRAGIKSPAFYRHVVSGERNLTEKTIPLFVKGLNLDERQGKFFSALVRFNQARSASRRQEYLEQMRGLIPKIREKLMPVDLYRYYSNWYNITIRELACILEWGENYGLLASKVRPAITKRQARDSVSLLLELGMIKKDPEGGYTQSWPHVTTSSEVVSESVKRVNHQMARLGMNALYSIPPTERDISSLTIGISREEYKLVKTEIQFFKDRVKKILTRKDRADIVYNLNVQLFPLSEDIDNTGKNGKGEC